MKGMQIRTRKAFSPFRWLKAVGKASWINSLMPQGRVRKGTNVAHAPLFSAGCHGSLSLLSIHCLGNWVFFIGNVMEKSSWANIHAPTRLHRRCLGSRDKKGLRAFRSRSTRASLSTKGCLETFVVTRRGGLYRFILVSRESRGAAKQPTGYYEEPSVREPCLRSPYLEKGPQHVPRKWLEETCGREDVQCGSPTPSTTALLEQITQMFPGVRSALHQSTPKKAGLFRARSTGKWEKQH